MNFKTSYIYDLVDKLSPKLSKINNNLKKTASQVKKSASKSVSAFKKFGKSIDTTAKKAKDLDPMNGIRKAAKDGDWTSMLVEYAANKSGLGGIMGELKPKEATKQPKQKDNLGLK